MILGLTGGVACGKSMAAQILAADYAFGVIDSDHIVHDLLKHEALVIESIVHHLGSQVLSPEGWVDRSCLAKIVFADTKELEWLEALLHPHVIRKIEQGVTENLKKNWVVEMPLLFEIHAEFMFDYVVCVAASKEVRLKRLQEAEMSHAWAREERQFPLEEKMKRADFVILNNTSVDALRQQLALLIAELHAS